MTQYIEPVPLKHIGDSQRLARLIDDGGCTGPLDEGVCCYFLSPPDDLDECQWDSRKAQRILKEAIGRAWGLT